MRFHRCSAAARPCSPPVVIGRAWRGSRLVEIVAHSSAKGLCLWVDRPRRGVSSGGCGQPSSRTIDLTAYRPDYWSKRSYTEVWGVVGPQVDSVRFSWTQAGQRRSKEAFVAVARGNLLRKTKQRRPFGVAVFDQAGCVGPRTVSAAAFDRHGERLGADRLASLPGCGKGGGPPEPPPQTGS